jgi:GTP-binding protein HflX
MALAEAVSLAAALPAWTSLWRRGGAPAALQPGMLFGSGKVAELKARIERPTRHIDLVLIDGPVSAGAAAQPGKGMGRQASGPHRPDPGDLCRPRPHPRGRVAGGTGALSYQRSRLVRAWTHLERQRGGFGFVGGPGETQIEADRRAIDDQVIRLKRQLEKVVKTRELHRAAPRQGAVPDRGAGRLYQCRQVDAVQPLTGAEVLAKDMLFATLDPTMRAVVLPSGARSSCRTPWASSRTCRRNWSPPSAPRWKRC